MSSRHRLFAARGGRGARYLASGHLVYAQDGTHFGAPFDLDRLDVTGPSVPMVDGVLTPFGAAEFSISNSRDLIYVAGRSAAEEVRNSLVWVDRNGMEEALAIEPQVYFNPRVPPGTRKTFFSST
ncbi:MAG TPA: hypothetical protein VEK15_13465 [Vicinamibacteria bacterium]|nr:hypothetical protein [Vicinamibacteria bacterium]